MKKFNLYTWIKSFTTDRHIKACMMIAYQKGRQQFQEELLEKAKKEVVDDYHGKILMYEDFLKIAQ